MFLESELRRVARAESRACACLLLVGLSVILGLSAGLPLVFIARTPSRLKVIMSSTPKQDGKAEGKVIASMLKDYQGLVAGTSALSYAFIKKHKAVVQRDIEATLKEGAKAGDVSGIRHTYSKQFAIAGFVLENKWTFPANVADFMKEVEVFHRAYGAKDATEKASALKSWADFVKAGRAQEKRNASAKAKKQADNGMTGASQGNAEGERAKAGSKVLPVEVMSGELVIPDTIAGVVTVGMSLKFFAKRLNSAKDISLSADEVALADEVIKRLSAIVKVAKSANHPSVKAKAKA